MAELLGGTTIGGYKATHIGNIQEHIKTTSPPPASPSLTKRVLTNGDNNINASTDSPVNIVKATFTTVANVIPLFDSSVWEIVGGQWTNNSPVKTTLVSNAAWMIKRCTVDVKPGTTYTLSFTKSGSTAYGGIKFINTSNVISAEITNSASQASSSYHALTFTTLINTKKIEVSITSTTAGTYTFENVMLNEGSSVKPFVSNVKGTMNPTIQNISTGDSLSVLGSFHEIDTFYSEKGQLKISKKSKEIFLDGSLRWELALNATGYKIVRCRHFDNLQNEVLYGVNHDGRILNVNPATFTKENEISTYYSDGYIYVSIPTFDSGWADNYTPTIDEIKAYFWGWKLGSFSFATGVTTIPYVTGTSGFKVWVQIYSGSGVESTNPKGIVSGSGVFSEPKAISSPSYKRYRVICKQANAVEQSAKTIGSLALKAGNNNLVLSEGKIIREIAKPRGDLYNPSSSYRINNSWSVAGTESFLNYKAFEILAVYKNGHLDKEWIIHPGPDNGASNGTSMAHISVALYDPNAIYEVDYIPLEYNMVTNNTASLEVEYATNREGSLDQLIQKNNGNENKSDNYLTKDMINKPGGIAGVSSDGSIREGQLSKDLRLNIEYMKINYTNY